MGHPENLKNMAVIHQPVQNLYLDSSCCVKMESDTTYYSEIDTGVKTRMHPITILIPSHYGPYHEKSNG